MVLSDVPASEPLMPACPNTAIACARSSKLKPTVAATAPHGGVAVVELPFFDVIAEAAGQARTPRRERGVEGFAIHDELVTGPAGSLARWKNALAVDVGPRPEPSRAEAGILAARGKLLLAQAAQTVKRASMELGGHAPVVVCEDADVDAAAAQCAAFKYRNAGQVCIAPSRFYVHEDVAERFGDGMVAAARALVLGDSQDTATTMGPLTLASQRDRVEALCAETVADGARCLTGGRRPAGRNKGFFFEPTVLADVPDGTRIMREEPFGPLAPIATFSDLDDALERANATPFGLAAYAFTSSQKKADALSRGLRAGMVGINTFMIAHAEAPFGGIGHSGMGREGGRQAINDYLNVKMTYFIAA